MARNRRWRMSRSEWSQVFENCLVHPDRSHLVRAAVAFDFRHVFGGLDIVRPLVAIERQAPQHPDFLRRLARTATDVEPAVKRRGKLDVGKDGRLDLKRRAVLPIANLARFHSIACGVTISGTVERLSAAAAAGSLAHESATALTEAFELVLTIRRDHHVDRVKRGEPADDMLDPETLSELTRRQLVEALKMVAAEQRRLGRFVPIGL